MKVVECDEMLSTAEDALTAIKNLQESTESLAYRKELDNLIDRMYDLIHTLDQVV